MRASWTYKVILAGSQGTGKSTFIKNHQTIQDEKYLEDYSETIGTNFYIKKIPVGREKFCQLQFWDLNISENFYFVLPSFFRGSSAFLLFFDTSNSNSFADLQVWIDIIHSYSENIPIFLIGTKTDLNPDIPPREILDFIQNHGLYGPYFTSIKKKYYSEIIFNHIVETLTGIPIVANDHEILEDIQEEYSVNFNPHENRTDRGDCEDESQNNLLLLREIVEGNYTSPSEEKSESSQEECEDLGNILEYFKYCPVCHQENHKKYLQRFFLSKDPQKQSIKESVLHLIEQSEEEWDDRMYYNQVTVGIPCCDCFRKFFKQD
jgi:GTPase SAR1 family protein